MSARGSSEAVFTRSAALSARPGSSACPAGRPSGRKSRARPDRAASTTRPDPARRRPAVRPPACRGRKRCRRPDAAGRHSRAAQCCRHLQRQRIAVDADHPGCPRLQQPARIAARAKGAVQPDARHRRHRRQQGAQQDRDMGRAGVSRAAVPCSRLRVGKQGEHVEPAARVPRTPSRPGRRSRPRRPRASRAGRFPARRQRWPRYPTARSSALSPILSRTFWRQHDAAILVDLDRDRQRDQVAFQQRRAGRALGQLGDQLARPGASRAME